MDQVWSHSVRLDEQKVFRDREMPEDEMVIRGGVGQMENSGQHVFRSWMRNCGHLASLTILMR